MKKLLFVASLLVVFMIAPMAIALQIHVGSSYGPYQTGSGGEFAVYPDASLQWVLGSFVEGVTKNILGPIANTPWNENFQTFCVERGEYIYNSRTYEVSLSQASIFTGKPLTLGAAWLYHEFQIKGDFDGDATYDWDNPGRGGTAGSTADQLQQAIWYFMGAGSNPNNQFSIAGMAHGGFTPNNGSIPVAVMNLWAEGHLGEKGYERQDLLVCVPEPATMLLLGSGLLGLAGFARRRFKK